MATKWFITFAILLDQAWLPYHPRRCFLIPARTTCSEGVFHQGRKIAHFYCYLCILGSYIMVYSHNLHCWMFIFMTWFTDHSLTISVTWPSVSRLVPMFQPITALLPWVQLQTANHCLFSRGVPMASQALILIYNTRFLNTLSISRYFIH